MNLHLRRVYKELKAPAKASLWFIICGFLQKGISLLTTPVFTRMMTTQEYGRFSVYNSWYSIVQIIVSLNLAAGVYTKGLVKNEADRERFTSSMIGLSTTCILVWTIIYAVFYRSINSLLDMSACLVVAMLLETWATSAYQFWSNRERVDYKYKKLVALTLIYTLIRPTAGIIGVLNATRTTQVEGRVFLSTLISLLLFTCLYVSMMRKGRKFYSKEYWIYALKFNLPLVPHYLSQIVLNQADRIMIGQMCGETEAAYYSVAYTLSMVLQILNTSISGTMNPWIYKSLHQNEPEKIGKPSYAILLLIAVCNLMVIVAAPEIMLILAPTSYQSAAAVIPPVTASVYFMFLYNLFATFEYYFDKTRYVMCASLVGALVNIGLNAICIPRFGFVAAGYTTLFCYILYAIAHYCFMSKVVRKNFGNIRIYNAKLIAVIGSLLIIAAIGALVLYSRPILRYSILLCGFVIMFIKRKSIIDQLKRNRLLG